MKMKLFVLALIPFVGMAQDLQKPSVNTEYTDYVLNYYQVSQEGEGSQGSCSAQALGPVVYETHEEQVYREPTRKMVYRIKEAILAHEQRALIKAVPAQLREYCLEPTCSPVTKELLVQEAYEAYSVNPAEFGVETSFREELPFISYQIGSTTGSGSIYSIVQKKIPQFREITRQVLIKPEEVVTKKVNGKVKSFTFIPVKEESRSELLGILPSESVEYYPALIVAEKASVITEMIDLPVIHPPRIRRIVAHDTEVVDVTIPCDNWKKDVDFINAMKKFFDLPEDGLFDYETQKALLEFQLKNRFTSDGRMRATVGQMDYAFTYDFFRVVLERENEVK